MVCYKSHYYKILFGTTMTLGLGLVGLSVSEMAKAAMPQADYENALNLAEKKVLREKAAHSSTAGAVSSAMLNTLFGRYYQVGDNWDVAAWHTDKSSMMRMTDAPEQLKPRPSLGGIFHYEVTRVKTGMKPEVDIVVTQKEAFGLKTVDQKVEKLTLTMNDEMKQSLKAYSINGRLVKVSPEGIHSGITALELFPLDIPEVVTADRQTVTKLPELPADIQSVANRTSYASGSDLSQSMWFEQDDFFGRPISMLWQHGNPWPSYLKTSNGIALLISKGAL